MFIQKTTHEEISAINSFRSEILILLLYGSKLLHIVVN